MTAKEKQSKINDVISKPARLVHPSYPGHAWHAVFKGRQTRVASGISIKAKLGSASCVCQWTNLVEIRKAIKKATIVFMAVLETLVDQSKVF